MLLNKNSIKISKIKFIKKYTNLSTFILFIDKLFSKYVALNKLFIILNYIILNSDLHYLSDLYFNIFNHQFFSLFNSKNLSVDNCKYTFYKLVNNQVILIYLKKLKEQLTHFFKFSKTYNSDSFKN